MKKKLLTLAASLAILAGGIFAYFAIATPANAASCHRDNDTNAIVKGGGCTVSELKSKIKGDIDNIYRHYGVPTSLSGAKTGEVRYNGDVVVDGKVVATGAQTVGRTKFGNSKKVYIDGDHYYQGSPQVRWAKGTKSMKAFVFFDSNGKYKGAVLSACGNPVPAHPKPVPPKPQPKVSYKCEALSAHKIDRTRYDLTVRTAQENATFKSVTFHIYKGSTKVDTKTTTSKTLRYTQATPGEYTIKAVASFTVNGKTKAADVGYCVTKITINDEPCPYNPSLPKGDKKCYEPCPYNPELPKDSSKCYEPCPYNPQLPKNSKDCEEPKKPVCPYNPELPKDSDKCYEKCPYNPELPKDSKDCEKPEEPVTPQTPETPEQPKGEQPPAELPKTGPEGVIGAFAGLGSIGTAGYYYVASRRELMSKLLNR